MEPSDPDMDYRAKAMKARYDREQLKDLGFEEGNYCRLRKNLSDKAEIIAFIDPRTCELTFTLSWWVKCDFKCEITREAINAAISQHTENMKAYISNIEGV